MCTSGGDAIAKGNVDKINDGGWLWQPTDIVLWGVLQKQHSDKNGRTKLFYQRDNVI